MVCLCWVCLWGVTCFVVVLTCVGFGLRGCCSCAVALVWVWVSVCCVYCIVLRFV